ncbi:hypothetical protein P7F60_14150 [Rhizobium sp. YJ-22]|uniref:hypothetical protein n=1 Tax=Rhizobium sp. YJ-22 TaxID=3037556 RepID=UPI002412B59A|nr:hypothetical protein [Rhizobium sp. YJ-22]MDG3577537.1 hypothetical protein [Rhizobium sp. YJ-22]
MTTQDRRLFGVCPRSAFAQEGRAFALVNEGVEIEATASRYDKTAREINAAFYTPALVDKASTRVEV